MARSIDTIKAAIDTDIAADDILSTQLTSTSDTAIWKLFRAIIAAAVNLHEQLFDAFTTTVNAIAVRAVPGTGPWYLQKIAEFQYGDIVEILPDYSVGYALVDATKQIITQKAVTKVDGDLAAKVRKASGPLTADEQNGLSAYLHKISFAGTVFIVISDNDDLLRVTGNFYYDPQIALADVKTSLDSVMDAFLTNLPFDGQFQLSKYKTQIETVLGYVDFQATSIQASDAGGASYAEVTRIYNPISGILSHEHELSTVLTFIPNV